MISLHRPLEQFSKLGFASAPLCAPLADQMCHSMEISRMLNVDVLAPISGAHFNWIVLISQPLTVLIIQMVRVVDVDYITLNHAVAVAGFVPCSRGKK